MNALRSILWGLVLLVVVVAVTYAGVTWWTAQVRADAAAAAAREVQLGQLDSAVARLERYARRTDTVYLGTVATYRTTEMRVLGDSSRTMIPREDVDAIATACRATITACDARVAARDQLTDSLRRALALARVPTPAATSTSIQPRVIGRALDVGYAPTLQAPMARLSIWLFPTRRVSLFLEGEASTRPVFRDSTRTRYLAGARLTW